MGSGEFEKTTYTRPLSPRTNIYYWNTYAEVAIHSVAMADHKADGTELVIAQLLLRKAGRDRLLAAEDTLQGRFEIPDESSGILGMRKVPKFRHDSETRVGNTLRQELGPFRGNAGVERPTENRDVR